LRHYLGSTQAAGPDTDCGSAGPPVAGQTLEAGAAREHNVPAAGVGAPHPDGRVRRTGLQTIASAEVVMLKPKPDWLRTLARLVVQRRRPWPSQPASDSAVFMTTGFINIVRSDIFA